jgi:hypothetical protein
LQLAASADELIGKLIEMTQALPDLVVDIAHGATTAGLQRGSGGKRGGELIK